MERSYTILSLRILTSCLFQYKSVQCSILHINVSILCLYYTTMPLMSTLHINAFNISPIVATIEVIQTSTNLFCVHSCVYVRVCVCVCMCVCV